MFTLPPDSLSEQHHLGMKKGKDKKGREGKKCQKGATNIKGAMMMLVKGEIPKGLGTQMGMTGTKGIHSTIMTLQTTDQPEVLRTEGIPTENSKRHHPKTSDQRSRTLGAAQEQWGIQ